MTDGEALLKAIDAAADRATARMVYSDHLDDGGEHLAAALQRVLAEPACDRHRLDFAAAVEPSDPARAEFVRVHCAVDAMERGHRRNSPGTFTGAMRVRPLRERAEGLFYSHADRWFPVPPGYGFDWGIHLAPSDTDSVGRPGWYMVRCGFVEAVTCEAADWLAHGDAICAAHPVEQVRLTDEPDLCPRVELCENKRDRRWTVHGTANIAGRVVAAAYVTLTESDLFAGGDPGPALYRARAAVEARMRGADLLAARWPGVAFELPRRAESLYEEVNRQLRGQIAAGLGVAPALL